MLQAAEEQIKSKVKPDEIEQLKSETQKTELLAKKAKAVDANMSKDGTSTRRTKKAWKRSASLAEWKSILSSRMSQQ